MMIEMIEGEGGLKCYGYEVPRVVVNRDTPPELVRLTRINIGCGHTQYLDAVNVDISEDVRPDVIFNFLERPWPFIENTFSSATCFHVLEHISNPLPFMEELARVCCPGAVAMFKMPYGSSDNAWEDPTHVRPYFIDSFGYFSQAAYGGADYGYKGDWTTISRELLIKDGLGYEKLVDDLEQLLGVVMTVRNVVDEMKIVCRNVKPPRSPSVAREAAPISFVFHKPKLPPQQQGEKPS